MSQPVLFGATSPIQSPRSVKTALLLYDHIYVLVGTHKVASPQDPLIAEYEPFISSGVIKLLENNRLEDSEVLARLDVILEGGISDGSLQNILPDPSSGEVIDSAELRAALSDLLIDVFVSGQLNIPFVPSQYFIRLIPRLLPLFADGFRTDRIADQLISPEIVGLRILESALGDVVIDQLSPEHITELRNDPSLQDFRAWVEKVSQELPADAPEDIDSAIRERARSEAMQAIKGFSLLGSVAGLALAAIIPVAGLIASPTAISVAAVLKTAEPVFRRLKERRSGLKYPFLIRQAITATKSDIEVPLELR